MPKWKSPLFSDIRNAIGDNVVFSQWKGRPFFRSYVIPANPNTFKQQAERLNSTDVLKRFQPFLTDADTKAAWNKAALPYLISGCNLFVKYGRSSDIKVDKASGATPLSVTLTYNCKIPLAKAAIFQMKDGAITIVAAAGTLSAAKDSTLSLTGLAAATYYWFLGDVTVLKGSDVAPQAYQMVTKWCPKQSDGTDTECICVVSA